MVENNQNKILLPFLAASAILAAMVIGGCTQPWGGAGGGGSSSTSSSSGLHTLPGGSGVNAQALSNLTVNVVDETGAPLGSGFRWLVEEDTAYQTVPGVSQTETVGTGIHRSHRPVLSAGEELTATATILAPDDKYLFISVLPLEEGWQNSGARVVPGQASVTITVVAPPLPTAQISVYVFEDNQPLNSAPDVPAEQGLAGFSIIIHDALGQQMMDAFGNMIGTDYMREPDGSYMLDGDGMPMVMMMGNGYVLTDANGEALIKNLAPGKYGVIAIPPDGTDWVLTSTIEGTPVVDAWVAHNEPPWFAEFGFFDWHCFYGFIHPTTLPPGPGSTGTLHGQAVYVHDARPPKQPGNFPGVPIPDAWVGLNNLSGNDEMVYAQPCDPDTGEFTIANVPPGLYQLVIWDFNLDVIIDFRTVTVPPEGGVIEMGQVAAYGWFGSMVGSVFDDVNQNGFPDPGEAGVPDTAVNLRFADGSIYQSTVTNPTGGYCFNEIFPWFHFIITEIDFVRYKATGATIIVDDGGTVESGAYLHPQPQPENGGLGWRTELGEVLLEAVQLMLDQTHEIHWGKTNYGPGENGGITGITYYAATRAENDPRLAVMDPWEPGIPRIQVELYQDSDFDQVIDDLDGSGGPTRADVDNWPFGWRDGGTMGFEDVDRNGNGTFDPGDAIQITTSDSFDDNPPTGCVGPVQMVHGHTIRDCAETLATWGQVRPGVFDGGYAFGSYFPGGMAAGGTEMDGIPTGYYIVGVSPSPGYEIVKEEDKNVDFGEHNTPSTQAMPVIGPPVCVGDGHTVPDQLTLFPGVTTDAAGLNTPLCDLKSVLVKNGRNAAADFPLFTVVPKASMGWGMVFDDLALQFDRTLPDAGSNMGVPWLPISIQDWAGREVTRVYTDEWGKYNVTLPGTYSANVPAPSGVAPNMFNICLNHPGPIPDPNNPGVMITDPYYNPGYGRVCVFLNFFSGKTTFMDTPILPIAAFTPNRTPLDCDYADGTPVIDLVVGPTGGPYVAASGNNITITSRGPTLVPNPDYDPTNPLSQKFITRQYGFGAVAGTVSIDGNTLPIIFWNDAVIIATMQAGVATGQLEVVKFDGTPSLMGITVHVGGPQISEVRTVSAGQSIQAQIDAAADNALILIGPGEYQETLLITKPIKLQGAGAYSTKINVPQLNPTEQLEWRAKVQPLIDDGTIVVLPEQQNFFQQSGGGVLVSYPAATVTDPGNPPLLDGLQITGAIRGGGIFVNTYVRNLQISNNKVYSNEGNFGGGIRVGSPSIVNATGDGFYSSNNQNVYIHHNLIAQNGGIDGGGGITLFNGSDDYLITDNFICGNFALLYGGGIDHFGLSDNGEISFNRIISNQSFDEGGGIMIAGELVPGGAPAGTLTEGSGSVMINANVILGNMSGDDGGGIRTLMTSGQDVQNAPTDPSRWHQIDILNNFIVNNVSWDAGGGMSLDDSAAVNIINNTIAHNDATSNGTDAFAPCVDNVPPGTWCPGETGGGGLTTSVPQAAGIAVRSHSLDLQAAFGAGFEQIFTNPVLEDNIIYQNRSFYWDAAYNLGLGGLRPDIGGGEAPVYWDLAVYGTPAPEFLSPMSGILTDVTGYDGSNVAASPLFVDGTYFNSFLATSSGTALGNFVVVTFKLPGSHGEYHILAGSPALNLGDGLYLGTYPELNADIDGESRPFSGGVDAGADERH